MEEVFCTNHPEIYAKRRCFLCKKPICKKCIIRKHYHIFCSEECAKEYRKEFLLKSIKKKAKTPIPIHFLVLIILLSFGLIFFIAYKFKDELLSFYVITLKEKVFDSASNVIKINSKIENKYYKFKVLVPGKGILLFSGRKGDFFWLPVSEKENNFSSYKIKPPDNAAFLPQYFLNLNKSFNKGLNSMPILSLTFDGGSSKGLPEEIINYLIEEDLYPTFFLTGSFIKNYSNIVKIMADRNFEIGNHTLTHPHLTTYSKNFKQETLENLNFEKLKKELEETNLIFKSLTGKYLKCFWRAPYGEYNEEILNWGWRAGYYHIGWSWDSLDWMDEDFPNFERRINKINELKEKIQKNEKELYGQILLFHLGSNNLGEIKEIVKLIKSKNIQIVPVSTLLTTDTFSKL